METPFPSYVSSVPTSPACPPSNSLSPTSHASACPSPVLPSPVPQAPASLSLPNHFFKIIFIGIFLISFGLICLLPPFAGIDELGHYASLREIATTGKVPLLGESYLPKELDSFFKIGPFSVRLNSSLDLKQKNFQDFFSDPARVALFKEKYLNFSPRPDYENGSILNWEAQHPPLYYYVFAPILILTDQLDLVTALLILRTASFLVAFAGLFVSFLALKKMGLQKWEPYIFFGFALYPVLAPQFFVHFARITNDAFCLLFFGLFLLAWTHWQTQKNKLIPALAMALCCAAGLATKGLFLPIFFGLALFVTNQLWQHRHLKDHFTEMKEYALMMAIPCLLVCAWYLAQITVFGNPSGTLSLHIIKEGSSLFHSFWIHFELKDFLHRIFALFMSWILANSHELPQFGILLPSPLILFNIWLAAYGVYGFYKTRMTLKLRHPLPLDVKNIQQPEKFFQPILLPPLLQVTFFLAIVILGLFGAGFLYHIFTIIALQNGDLTPAWYLHMLSAFFAIIFGIAFAKGKNSRFIPPAIFVMSLYGFMLLIFRYWAYFNVYAGAINQNSTTTTLLQDTKRLVAEFGPNFHNLQILCWPSLSLISFTLGLAIYFTGICCGFRTLFWAKPPAHGPAPLTSPNF